MGVDNPFDTLGLRPSFDISAAALSRAFLARVAASHPDLADPDAEQETAAKLNEARAVLADPERRADALLRLRGGPAKDADRSLPDGFLLAMMQRREEIEDALRAGGPLARETWQRWAAEQRADYESRVGAMFRDNAPPAAIRRELNAWRYIERLIEQLDPHYDPARADHDKPPQN